VGIGAQQAPDEAQEFEFAAPVYLLRITESAGRPELALIAWGYRAVDFVRCFVKSRDGDESAITDHVHQNFDSNGHGTPLR